MPEQKLKLQPDYGHQGHWEAYEQELAVEYNQCVEEGKDIAQYRALFDAVRAMPPSEYKAKLAETLFDLQMNAPIRSDYTYNEPDDLQAIRALRPEWQQTRTLDLSQEELKDRVRGAWVGRTCGCLLGKPIEGIRTNDLYPLLKESGNWPMTRYILSTDLSERCKKETAFLLEKDRQCWADVIDRAPSDDDTNYTVLYQLLVEKYGRDFTPENVAAVWLWYQPKNAYCTAERVAYCNFVKGYKPPVSAVWHNPYREWIGAQIRGDFFGYINPGNPVEAAKMAYRDACISQVKNGIYGEMFAAAMIAEAAVTSDRERIIEAGLSVIPVKSRMTRDVRKVLGLWKAGKCADEIMEVIHTDYNEHTENGWCYTNSNAMVVAMAILCGEGDYSKSICLAVQACFDTDCNGATVGSVIGMMVGESGIDPQWTAPFERKLMTTIEGYNLVDADELAEMTAKLVK